VISLPDGGAATTVAASFLPRPSSKVPLSTVFKGSKCVVDGSTAKGTGTVLAEAPLHQDRVYWEVTLAALPDGADFALGVARKCVGGGVRWGGCWVGF
jgi:hypothetical protein